VSPAFRSDIAPVPADHDHGLSWLYDTILRGQQPFLLPQTIPEAPISESDRSNTDVPDMNLFGSGVVTGWVR
jgi:hypothetical protein